MTDIIGGIIALMKVLIGLMLAIISIYVGIFIFEFLTKIGWKEELGLVKELKEQNIAMGILLAGIVLAMAIVIQAGLEGLTVGGEIGVEYFQSLGLAIFQVMISLIFSIIVIFLAIWLLNKIIPHYCIIDEIKNGNIAVAIVAVSIIMAISFIVASTVSGIAIMLGT